METFTNRNNTKKVLMKVAIMATLYERRENAVRTIQSIALQVDEVRVILNIRGAEPVAEWIDLIQSAAPNVDIDISDNRLGCGERFRGVKTKGYYFTCDDDLIYPDDYVGIMMYKVDLYKCVVSMHGRRFTSKVIDRYYGCRDVEAYRCLYNDSIHDLTIHVPGAGVMAWHTNDVDLSYGMFNEKNMDDVEVARICHQQGVGIKFIAHAADYFEYMPPPAGTTIHDIESPSGGVEQTRIVNEILKEL